VNTVSNECENILIIFIISNSVVSDLVHLQRYVIALIIIISGLFRGAANGWFSTYMIDTIKKYSPE